MAPVGRATPDSEAVASEDERPWPTRPSFGSLPRREMSVPGLPGDIWTAQRRDSFRMAESRKPPLASPGSWRPTQSPSPPSSDGAAPLPIAIPPQPMPKPHRSLSHSLGQRDASQATMSPAPWSLGLLTEEADDDRLGAPLFQTVSNPLATLHRDSTTSATHDILPGLGMSPTTSRLDPRLEAGLAGLTFDRPPRRSQWQSHLGWDGVPTINGSRRHSLADIPTRRGSLTAEDGGMRLARDTVGDYEEVRIPPSYRVPHVKLRPEESGEQPPRISDGRPRKLLYIVSFKCSRVEIFYLLDNTGLNIREGDVVIVEADRGQDLGTVQHVNVTPEQARLLKRKYAEEQYKWLMMFSRSNQPGSVNPNPGSNNRSPLLANAPATIQGMPRDNYNALKPKAIKRLANAHEIKMLADKEGNEAKAKRTCQQKVQYLHLEMEILDAEWQWDFQKLIFYYYADHYINFKDLITDLYRIYKIRIWMSAVNPASFSQQALGQPPSGIGPGAVANAGPVSNMNDLSHTYTMAYGPDPDPYGAVPPYRIGPPMAMPQAAARPGAPMPAFYDALAATSPSPPMYPPHYTPLPPPPGPFYGVPQTATGFAPWMIPGTRQHDRRVWHG
ncbi:PSP1-domain-containing protein [Piedraia hortae CBS 480.64]|uniref:PSP1-domain-containing protein n=1 Tax=Piedraia hortae CBS 480.64 TaxID=1314780 RepID=A0A6A7CBE4_9PEZI|nr:PSP1-domain-containing protein [Piedraia hortae CBS 480.64]